MSDVAGKSVEQLVSKIRANLRVGAPPGSAPAALSELASRAAERDALIESLNQSERGLSPKVQDQQARLRKLERKYATAKGDLRVANDRARTAEAERDRLTAALERLANVIGSAAETIMRDIAREALKP